MNTHQSFDRESFQSLLAFHDPNATAQLQELLTNATPAGQLYALLGLRTRDRAAYEHGNLRAIDEA